MTLDQRIARYPRRHSKAISYRETGAGQALVLLHGIGSSSAGWLCQLESLAGYRLIAWDAPGYGESEFLLLRHRALRITRRRCTSFSTGCFSRTWCSWAIRSAA